MVFHMRKEGMKLKKKNAKGIENEYSEKNNYR